MNKIMIISTLACAFVFAPALPFDQAEAAQNCLNTNVAEVGSSRGAVAKFRQRRAERRAVSQWESYVAENFGTSYADASKAIVLEKSCSASVDGLTSCRFRAKPCS